MVDELEKGRIERQHEGGGDAPSPEKSTSEQKWCLAFPPVQKVDYAIGTADSRVEASRARKNIATTSTSMRASSRR